MKKTVQICPKNFYTKNCSWNHQTCPQRADEAPGFSSSQKETLYMYVIKVLKAREF